MKKGRKKGGRVGERETGREERKGEGGTGKRDGGIKL
jgi:hypothetical protein